MRQLLIENNYSKFLKTKIGCEVLFYKSHLSEEKFKKGILVSKLVELPFICFNIQSENEEHWNVIREFGIIITSKKIINETAIN